MILALLLQWCEGSRHGGDDETEDIQEEVVSVYARGFRCFPVDTKKQIYESVCVVHPTEVKDECRKVVAQADCCASLDDSSDQKCKSSD